MELEAFTNDAVVVFAPSLDVAIALHDKHCDSCRCHARKWRKVDGSQQVQVINTNTNECALGTTTELLEVIAELDSAPIFRIGEQAS